MIHVKSFDRKTKSHKLLTALVGGFLFVSLISAQAENVTAIVVETPITPVESSDIPGEMTTIRMVGIADQPPPAEGQGNRVEDTTTPPPPPPVMSVPDPVPVPAQPEPLPPIVESPPPPTPVSLPPVVTTGTIAPVERPDSYSISSFGSASNGSGVPAPQVYNGYQAPPSAFLQGSSNYQAPAPQPTKKPTFRKTQAQLASEQSMIANQARVLYDGGDKQGAERLIQTLPASEQGYTRDYVTGGGAEDLLPPQEVAEIVLDPTKKIKAVGVVGEVVFKTTSEATKAAVKMGYRKIRELSNGEAVYKKGDSYITRDIGSGNGLGSHNGGAWKEANSVKNLGTPEARNGTFNADLSIKVGK